jgi:hypothetical protein
MDSHPSPVPHAMILNHRCKKEKKEEKESPAGD